MNIVWRAGFSSESRPLPTPVLMIITPDNDPQKPTAEEQFLIDANRHLYEQDPELKVMADKIHHDRLLAGDACDQCICIAIHMLNAKKARAVK